jgi:ABC-type phosphate transport system substrate-binding protein
LGHGGIGIFLVNRKISMNLRLVTIVGLLAWVANSSGQIVVIANKSVPMDTIKKTLLLDFYACDIKKWSDGQPVIVLDLKLQDGIRTTFYNYLGKSSSRMKSIWLKKLLSGEGDPPQTMNSEEELLKKVAATAGAIGFISKAKVHKDVKILLEITDEKKQE